MIKKYMSFMLILLLGVTLIACQDQAEDITTTTTENIVTTTSDDTIPPLFIGLVNNQLTPLEHSKGEEIDLLVNVNAIDNTSDVSLSIIDDGGYDKDRSGVYTIVIQVEDEAGNTATANRQVSVLAVTTVTFDALKIDDEAIEYLYNNSNALKYTSSGTAFRSNDAIYVMTKEFFINEYNEHQSEHITNGHVPYLPHGVIAVLDANMVVKELRIAAGMLVEVDENSNLKTNNLNWTNSIDEVNGGGNFKGLIDEIETLVPDGGYIIFTSNKNEELGKKFLIKNLYDKNYDGGAITKEQQNVDLSSVSIELIEDYTEEIEVVEEHPYGVLVKEEFVYEGIPFNIYYKNDNEEKSILYFFHGFGSDKEAGIMDRGETLAEMGFLVVSIDAYLHGDRETEYFKNLSYGDKQKEIVNIQLHTANDAKLLFDKYFKTWENVNPTKTYAFGVSMGAGTTFYLATIMDELETFASIVGSPSFHDFYQYKRDVYNWRQDDYYTINLESYRTYDPLINYERLAGKNIFMGNGLKDTIIPLEYAEELASLLSSQNIVFKTYDTSHSSTPGMLDDAYQFLLNN